WRSVQGHPPVISATLAARSVRPGNGAEAGPAAHADPIPKRWQRALPWPRGVGHPTQTPVQPTAEGWTLHGRARTAAAFQASGAHRIPWPSVGRLLGDGFKADRSVGAAGRGNRGRTW